MRNLLFKCVTCRRLHHPTKNQQTQPYLLKDYKSALPFTFVEVDVFGLWEVVSHCTRGGHAFIKALHRLIAINGPAKQIRQIVVCTLLTQSRISSWMKEALDWTLLKGTSKKIASFGCLIPLMDGAREWMVGMACHILDCSNKEHTVSHTRPSELSWLRFLQS